LARQHTIIFKGYSKWQNQLRCKTKSKTCPRAYVFLLPMCAHGLVW